MRTVPDYRELNQYVSSHTTSIVVCKEMLLARRDGRKDIIEQSITSSIHDSACQKTTRLKALGESLRRGIACVVWRECTCPWVMRAVVDGQIMHDSSRHLKKNCAIHINVELEADMKTVTQTIDWNFSTFLLYLFGFNPKSLGRNCGRNRYFTFVFCGPSFNSASSFEWYYKQVV